MANILIVAGNTALTGELCTRLTITGGGLPVWEKVAELGFQDTGTPRVAVVTKVDPSGLRGSRFVASGRVDICIEAKRIWSKAAHKNYKYDYYCCNYDI